MIDYGRSVLITTKMLVEGHVRPSRFLPLSLSLSPVVLSDLLLPLFSVYTLLLPLYSVYTLYSEYSHYTLYSEYSYYTLCILYTLNTLYSVYSTLPLYYVPHDIVP
jgi:hypothetical protein